MELAAPLEPPAAALELAGAAPGAVRVVLYDLDLAVLRNVSVLLLDLYLATNIEVRLRVRI